MFFHSYQTTAAAATKLAITVVLLGLLTTPCRGFNVMNNMPATAQARMNSRETLVQHTDFFPILHAESDSSSSTTTSTSLSAASMSIPFEMQVVDYQSPAVAKADSASTFKIFCDLDGVLVDFEAGVQEICHRRTDELPKWAMWDYVSRVDGFFEKLKWTPEGPELWQAIQHLSPDILTGIPDLESSRKEKFRWCKDKLGNEKEYHHVDMAGRWYSHSSVNGNKVRKGVCNVITCWSYNKHHHSGKNRILIDDRIALKKGWESKGGIFVHHTNLESTLTQLKEVGVL